MVLHRLATDKKGAEPRVIQSERSYMYGTHLETFLEKAEVETLPNFDAVEPAMRVMDVLGATPVIDVWPYRKDDRVIFNVIYYIDDHSRRLVCSEIVEPEMYKTVIEDPAKFWPKCKFDEEHVDILVKAIRGPMAVTPPPTGVAVQKKIKMNVGGSTPSSPPASPPASPPSPSTAGSKEGWSTGSKVMAGILAGGFGVGGAVALKFIVGAALRKAHPRPMGNMQNMEMASDAIDEDCHGALDQSNVTFKSNRIPH
eukprot:GHVT01040886.1.p1 GENE.GHVT01040886.1~~GHVT01040886.1.p1  ORF type:complete len:255 (+),score=34.08 GHVT01040886.1:1314-2078(+)